MRKKVMLSLKVSFNAVNFFFTAAPLKPQMSSVLHINVKHKQIMKGAANVILIKSRCTRKLLRLHMEHYSVVLFVEEPDPLWLVGIVAFSLSSHHQTLFALHMRHARKKQPSLWRKEWGTISKTYNSTIACSRPPWRHSLWLATWNTAA